MNKADKVGEVLTTLFTGSPGSKYEHRSALLRNIQNIRICMGEKNLS